VAGPPLVPELRRIKRRIWIFSFGGGLLFVGTVLLLAAMNPKTPANQLVDRTNIGLFVPSVAMAIYGTYVSVRHWRCPQCGRPLPTKFRVKDFCPRCGRPQRIVD